MSPRSGEIPYRIEAAAESDWPWIVQGQVETIWVRLSPERQRRISRQTIEEYVEGQVARLRKDESFPSQAFMARAEDGTSAGFVWVARDHNDTTGELEATLLNQYVAEPFRGQGLGRRLLETAEEWARGQGLPRLSLGRCAEHNRPEALRVPGLSSGNPADDQEARPGRA